MSLGAVLQSVLSVHPVLHVLVFGSQNSPAAHMSFAGRHATHLPVLTSQSEPFGLPAQSASAAHSGIIPDEEDVEPLPELDVLPEPPWPAPPIPVPPPDDALLPVVAPPLEDVSPSAPQDDANTALSAAPSIKGVNNVTFRLNRVRIDMVNSFFLQSIT